MSRITVSSTIAPAALLEELAQYYEREVGQLNVRAGWTTGAEKRARLAEAAYAERQAKFLRSIIVEEGS